MAEGAASRALFKETLQKELCQTGKRCDHLWEGLRSDYIIVAITGLIIIIIIIVAIVIIIVVIIIIYLVGSLAL